jgi:hypothetical protein
MPRTTAENGLPLPKSLATVREVRRETVALYRQAKGGVVDPQLAGRLAHILHLLVNFSRDVDLEARLAALEEALDIPRPAGANGHDRPAGVRPWTR